MTIRYSDDLPATKFAVQSYAALVLARQQKPPLGALRDVWQRHEQAKAALPLMQLGVALKLMGDAQRSEQAINLALKTSRVQNNRWLADYGSDLRDNALMLALLQDNNLLPQVQTRLLTTLSEQAYGQRWLSTRRVTRCFWPGVTCKMRPVAGRRKPRSMPLHWVAIMRRAVTGCRSTGFIAGHQQRFNPVMVTPGQHRLPGSCADAFRQCAAY